MQKNTVALLVIIAIIVVAGAGAVWYSQGKGQAVGEDQCKDPADVGRKAYEANCTAGSTSICCAKAERVCKAKCGTDTPEYKDCMKAMCAGSKCKDLDICKDYKPNTA